jgi:thioredoxin-like negative regulator of GroEL
VGGSIARMALFRRAAPPSRTEVLAAADRAHSRGRLREAVQGYDEALRGDPADAAVNLRIAPLLAKLGDVERSAQCFRRAAAAHVEAGFTDRASGVCAAAVATFPLDAGFRLEAARLDLARGRRRDAVDGLVDGGRALARVRRP